MSGIIEKIRFDEKGVKATPKPTDYGAVLDMEDLKPGKIPGTWIPKVKRALLSSFPGGGSGGESLSVFTNVIRIEPNATENIAGKLYKTFADADAYIQGQSPATDNRFSIELPSGDFNQNIIIRPHVKIEGHKTVLTGTVFSEFKFLPFENVSPLDNSAYIENCVITDLDLSNGLMPPSFAGEWEFFTAYSVDERVYHNTLSTGEMKVYKSLQDANTGNDPEISPTFWEDETEPYGMPVLFTNKCFFNVSAFVKPDAGDPNNLPCAIVSKETHYIDGDFTGKIIMFGYYNMFLAGEYPAYLSEPFMSMAAFTQKFASIEGGNYNSGKLELCSFPDSGKALEMKRGFYEIHTCVFNKAKMNFWVNRVDTPIPSYDGKSLFENCVLNGISFIWEPTGDPDQYDTAYDLIIRGGVIGGGTEVKVDAGSVPPDPLFMRRILTYGVVGTFTFGASMDQSFVRNSGDYYSNEVSGLSAGDFQNAIDEIVGMIPSIQGNEAFPALFEGDPHTLTSGVFGSGRCCYSGFGRVVYTHRHHVDPDDWSLYMKPDNVLDSGQLMFYDDNAGAGTYPIKSVELIGISTNNPEVLFELDEGGVFNIYYKLLDGMDFTTKHFRVSGSNPLYVGKNLSGEKCFMYQEPSLGEAYLYNLDMGSSSQIFTTFSYTQSTYIGNGIVLYVGSDNKIYRKNVFDGTAPTLVVDNTSCTDVLYIGNNEIIVNMGSNLYRKNLSDGNTDVGSFLLSLADFEDLAYGGNGQILYFLSGGVLGSPLYRKQINIK